ncbi:NAD(P)H-hydrate dehydratase [Herbiconiux sp. CPCC 205763]|uniref:ADP-dependent (S)-NAD(P)H-hydrate dehydratase n=1 Tax=Herbiconiux aconitum TaxID=2970913 RepID=A0ABT2GWD4_9MICO|nr:ADP/ATP-dependent (S)-NAD(P)H-hydrate dehydratase [Herbiconiux aconitum]MCS5719239.1 NAD(P)H-hydrate dehydratase [Herbiconiux aconitum]
MTTDAHDTETPDTPETPGTPWRDWTELDAAECIVVPGASDDKYSRGVLGVVTGSAEFPGAAVLGVEAAVRTGLGMVRYLGPGRPSRLVLQARPEVVTMSGRVQAWLVGSGMDAAQRSAETAILLDHALDDGVPLVVDAGALDLSGRIDGPAVLTPHAGELATLLSARGTEVDRATVAAHPEHWAAVAADATGHVVLLKGRLTHVCAPAREGTERVAVRIEAPSSWAATAGSGDVLGGIVGALVATNASALQQLDETAAAERLVALAATGAYVHAWAAERASDKGPIAALDIAHAVPRVIARLASGTRD